MEDTFYLIKRFYIKHQAVADQLITILAGNTLLDFFNLSIVKLNNLAGVGADHMIVMLTAIYLINRRTAGKIMSFNQTGRLKLREYTVDRCNTHIAI